MINKINEATDTQDISPQAVSMENTKREEAIREMIELRDWLESNVCGLYYWDGQDDE